MNDYNFIGVDAEFDYRVGRIAQDVRSTARRRSRSASEARSERPGRGGGRLMRLAHRHTAS